MTLERMAYTFSRLVQLDGGPADRRRDERPPGADRLRARRDRHRPDAAPRPGWIAKGGAEGLICAATPEGVGIALKVEDGNMRALRPALAAFLGLGDEFGAVPLENSRGERVGEIGA